MGPFYDMTKYLGIKENSFCFRNLLGKHYYIHYRKLKKKISFHMQQRKNLTTFFSRLQAQCIGT